MMGKMIVKLFKSASRPNSAGGRVLIVSSEHSAVIIFNMIAPDE